MYVSTMGSMFPAVKSKRIPRLNLYWYLVTTKATSEPKNKVKRTEGTVTINELRRYTPICISRIALK
jgi:hypothetical protein